MNCREITPNDLGDLTIPVTNEKKISAPPLTAIQLQTRMHVDARLVNQILNLFQSNGIPQNGGYFEMKCQNYDNFKRRVAVYRPNILVTHCKNRKARITR
jgi:hypothetical protein